MKRTTEEIYISDNRNNSNKKKGNSKLSDVTKTYDLPDKYSTNRWDVKDQQCEMEDLNNNSYSYSNDQVTTNSRHYDGEWVTKPQQNCNLVTNPHQNDGEWLSEKEKSDKSMQMVIIL
jgi:hypothetical protein